MYYKTKKILVFSFFIHIFTFTILVTIKHKLQVKHLRVLDLFSSYFYEVFIYINNVLQLANTEEYIDGANTGNLGEVLIRWVVGCFYRNLT